MDTSPKGQNGKKVERKRKWLTLSRDDWQQIDLLALATDASIEEILSGYVREGLSHIQRLRLTRD